LTTILALRPSPRSSRSPEPGIVITPLVERLLLDLWAVRQLTLAQIRQAHYAHVSERPGLWQSSLPSRACRHLVNAGFLACRPVPIERRGGGRPPLVYFLATGAAPVLSRLLDLPIADVLARIKQDRQLSWLFWRHRAAAADCYLALSRACEHAGTLLTWTGDEQLAGMKLTAELEGKRRSVRPDAFFVLDGSTTVPRFVEVQLTSEPRAYRLKAQGYHRFYASGDYERRFGFRSLRVLALTDTPTRAQHLREAVDHPSIAEPRLFWATTIAQFTADPFGDIWLVPQSAEPRTLLG